MISEQVQISNTTRQRTAVEHTAHQEENTITSAVISDNIELEPLIDDTTDVQQL
ncbi:22649_t:CDS:2, partial [Racocetra persica]